MAGLSVGLPHRGADELTPVIAVDALGPRVGEVHYLDSSQQ